VRSIDSINVGASNVFNLTVIDAVSVSNSINATYKLVILSQFPSSYYEQKLTSAVDTGLFTSNLRNISKIYNATAFSNSTCRTIKICKDYFRIYLIMPSATVIMPSESPTASPSIRIHHNFLGPGAIAGIVIAGIIFFVLLFSVTFHYCFQTQPISSKKYFQYAGLPRNDQSSSEFVARQGQSQFDDLNDFFPNSGHQNEQFFNTFSDQQNQRSGHSTKLHTAVLQGHQSRILCLNMSEKLGLLFSGSESGEIAVWKVENKRSQ
jgi:hypothetical protein